MGTIKIINNSTLLDYAAVLRVGMYMANNETATLNERLEVTIKIEVRNKAYIVTDIE